MNDCFCRGPARKGETSRDYCGRTVETCMGFHKPQPDDEMQYDFKEISREKALEMFEGWKEQGNLFRFMEDEGWICFCCSCGCQ